MHPYAFYAGWYSLSNGVSPVFLSRDLDQNCQGQTLFNYAILASIGRKNENIVIAII